MLTWELDNLEHPTAVIVHFESHEHAEHEELWRIFHTRGLGVAALPIASCDSTTSSVAPSNSRPLASSVTVAASTTSATGRTTDTDCAATASASTRSTAARSRLLSLPEAFYTLVATRWLTVPETLGSLVDIWERLSSAAEAPPQRQQQQQEKPRLSDFHVHFIAQYHLRELGWTLRSGLNYGGHYVLYRGAASAFHSEYIAYLKAADAPLSWGALQALTRVAADAKKTVLVCDIACSGESASTENHHSNTLVEGEYEFFGRTFRFSAVAIRFWDVAGGDTQTSSGSEQLRTFAFEPQPTLSKKPKKLPQSRAKRTRTSTSV